MSAIAARTIERCYTCARTCTSNAHTCMDDPAAYKLRAAIRLQLDCADMCLLAAGWMSRSSVSKQELLVRVLDLTSAVCRACAEECERHAGQECCRQTAVECRGCQEACTLAMQDIGGETGLVQTN